MAESIRVGVIDIYPIYREAVVRAVGRTEDLVMVAEGESAADATRIARQCDVLLVEPAVPHSLDAAKTILKDRLETKVIFLSAAEDDAHAGHALQLGVHGYLTKDITGTELVTAVRAAHAGIHQIAPELAWRLVRQSKAVVPAAAPAPLTVREQQILDHASRGLSNNQVAVLLGLNITTFKRHKARLFRKLGVRNLLQVFAKNRQV